MNGEPDAGGRTAGDAVQPGEAAGIAGFLASRWRAEVPLGILFWRDMLVWSSLVNLLMLIVSLLLLEMEYPLWLSLAAFFSLLPWNLFLVACIWRTAARRGGALATGAQFGALVWLAAATIL